MQSQSLRDDTLVILPVKFSRTRDHSGYGLGQWQTALHCNAACHWLSPCPEWFQSLKYWLVFPRFMRHITLSSWWKFYHYPNCFSTNYLFRHPLLKGFILTNRKLCYQYSRTCIGRHGGTHHWQNSTRQYQYHFDPSISPRDYNAV